MATRNKKKNSSCLIWHEFSGSGVGLYHKCGANENFSPQICGANGNFSPQKAVYRQHAQRAPVADDEKPGDYYVGYKE